MTNLFRNFGFFSTKTYNSSEELFHHNGFIINDGEDLKLSNAPSFENSFVTPQFGNNSYYTGITKESRIFEMKIMLIGRTMKQYREFLRWLSIDKLGWLVFDYMKENANTLNYGYYVKVASISEGVMFPSKTDCGADGVYTYDIELSISFVTVDDWAAIWIKNTPIKYLIGIGTEEDILIDNDLELNFYTGTTLTNNHNIKNYYEFSWEKTPDEDGYIEITIGDEVLCELTLDSDNDTGTINTRFGFILDQDNEFIDATINIGVWGIDANTSKTVTINEDNLTKFTIKPISREII